MKHTNHPTKPLIWKLISAGTLILTLLMPVLNVSAQNVADDEPPPRPALPTPQPPPPRFTGPQRQNHAWIETLLARPGPYATTAGFTILQTADTGVTGLDEGHIYNGDRITYTVELSNTTGATLTGITVVDILPLNALSDIQVTGATPWQFNYETQTLPDPAGRMVVITATREISWSVASLANGAAMTLSFSGNVAGQADNTDFTNRVFALYTIAGEPDPGSASAEELPITAHMRIPAENVGGTSISGVATWYSRDMGGTISQDWGDFDRDGDLDLALGSALGTTIYRNDDGKLALYWLSPPNAQDEYRLSYGVRWADVNPNNDQLELIAVGDVAPGTATFIAELPGINYVYAVTDTIKKFVETDTFTSTNQLVRIEPGDFDGDGDIDLVASTNAINADCPVILYRNLGTGNFTNAPNSDDVHNTECLSASNANGGGATAALSPADYDNDGDLDLALGVFPATLRLLINGASAGGPFTTTNPFTGTAHIDVETTLQYIPYDLAWGDYNADGYLDLAAAYPLQRTARIYNNSGGTLTPLTSTIRTDVFFTPRSVDWGDFNADGQLDILVANDPPGIYQFSDQSRKFEKVATLALPNIDGQVWSLRGINLQDTDALNVVVSNRDGPSQLFNAFGPKLARALTPITNKNMASVDWGDVDSDLDLDLLLGSGPAQLSSQLHMNKEGDLATGRQFLSSGFGPHTVAFGDMTCDGTLDIAIGTLEKLQIYTNDQIDDSDDAIDQSPTLTLISGRKVTALAWGDPNDDGKLDLLVGTEDAGGNPIVQLHLNNNGTLLATPAFTRPIASKVQSLLWKDFDGDFFLDFAVGQKAGPTLIFKNNGDKTYSTLWNSGTSLDTRSIDAADYDKDGDFDLVEGNFGAYDVVWENVALGSVTGTMTSILTFTTDLSQTTAVAWGDWDLDGYPDLAVGRYFAQDVVYTNKQSAPGEPQFTTAWYAEDFANTTGIAWGDRDNDGDPDLAVSRTGGGWSGYYENVTSDPAHIATDDTSKNFQLPNEAPYVYIERPGPTDDAYRFSSPNVLAGPTLPTMDIHYRIFDPEETTLATTIFEYSLDGGSVWNAATPAITPYTPTTRTSVIGYPAVFTWDAAADEAISDDARFRIRVIPQDMYGPVQKSANRGISPPFRIRATTCTWPTDVVISAFLQPTGTLIMPTQMISPGQEIELRAQFTLVSGEVLTQSWDFGDGTLPQDLKWPAVEPITHTFTGLGVYTITARIDGEACPIARPGLASRVFYVGVYEPLDKVIYLPLIMKGLSSSTATTPVLSAPSGGTPDIPWRALPSPAAAIIAAAPQPLAPLAALPGNAVQVTDSPLGVDSQPAINSDGTRIAFWSTGRHGTNNADGNIEIFLSRFDANGKVDPFPLQLTDSKGTILGGFNLGPSIDDAGNRVVFFSDQDLLAENNDGATVILANTNTALEQKNEDRNFEIYMADIENNHASLIQLTNTPDGENILPSISGDGTCIAFASNIDFTGTHQRQNGSGIFVAAITQTQNITWEVQYTQIVTPAGANDQPSISKNGRFVAFVSDQDLLPGGNTDNNREIFLAELENHQVKRYIQVTQTDDGVNEQPSIVSGTVTTSGDVFYVTFLSDQDWLNDGVPNANRDRQVALAVITATTTVTVDVKAIPQNPGEKDYPTISADGGRIAYISTADQKLHLYDVFEDRDIAKNADIQHAFPALSADGTQMAFVANWDVYRSEYPLVDLYLYKSASADKAIAGEVVTYTFLALNTGPSSATDVKVVDHLPAGLTADLKPWNPNDYMDTGTTGFDTCTGDGCEHNGTAWNAGAGALTIADFSGRVFDLPDAADTAPEDKWANMSSNVLLLHMDANPPPDVNPSGTTHTVIPDNAPSVIAGKINNAISFSGSNAYRTTNVLNTAGFGAASTWMAWVRMDSTSPGAFAGASTSLFDGWSIDFPAQDQIRFRTWNNWYATYTWVTEKTATITPDVGEWFHLAVVWRDSYWPSDVQIFINGREVHGSGYLYATYGIIGAPINWELNLGRDSFGSYFRGALDEVAVYTRLLSAGEILAIHDRQAPNYTAYFDSALMRETTGSNAWSTLSWVPRIPIGVELPDNGATWTTSDTLTLANSGYAPTGTLAMSGTVLLMHMNEGDLATSFFDTSGARDPQGYRNEAYCSGDRCPRSDRGRFNSALRFDGSNDYVYISEPKDFASTETTVMFWARTNHNLGGLFQYSVTDSPSSTDGNWRFQANEFSIHNPSNLQVRVGGQSYASGLSINDGEWHHIAVTWDNTAREIKVYKDGGTPSVISTSTVYTLTQPHGDNRFPARIVLGNRLEYNYAYATECFYTYYGFYYCYSFLTGLNESGQNPFDGTLDEVAVFKRALSDEEVQAAYVRGTGKMLFQVRTCTTAACDDANEYFVGPGGQQHTYFTDEPDLTTPLWSLGDINAKPYLQYRTYMEGYVPNDTPELITVTVRPRAECSSNGAQTVVTCTLSTEESPLPPWYWVIANIPVDVSATAYLSATYTNGQYSVENDARISAVEADHNQTYNTASVSLKLDPIIVTGVGITPNNLSGEQNQDYTFTAEVTPNNATPPVVYEWTTPGYGTQVFTVSTNWLTHTIPYSWTLAGVKTITVSARNSPSATWQTAAVDVKINHPWPVIDSITPADVDAYSANTNITINGSGFVDNAVTDVLWNGAPLATSNVVDANSMTAVIPASSIQLGGYNTIRVRNAETGLDTRPSNTAVFTVYNRVPTVNTVNPASTTVSTGVAVDISGNNFATTGAIARLYRPGAGGTVDLTPSALTRTQVDVTVPGSQIGTAGYYSLTVQNPVPYRTTGESASLLFTVYNPQPAITNFTPATTSVSTGFTLNVYGSNFVSGAQIYWNGTALATTRLNSGRLRATVSSAQVPGTPANVPVFVRNPAPSVGDSNTVQFPVQ